MNRSWRLRTVTGALVVALLGACAGWLVATGPWNAHALDPLEVVRNVGAAGVTCAQVVVADDASAERSAICVTTANEVLTIATFASPPDPDRWVAAICELDGESVVPTRGNLVEADLALVGVVARPLSVEEGGPVPDPDGVAAAVADHLDGSWRRIEC